MRLRRHKNGWLLLRLFMPVTSISKAYRIMSENLPLILYPPSVPRAALDFRGSSGKQEQNLLMPQRCQQLACMSQKCHR
jgi:hypothetical protein